MESVGHRKAKKKNNKNEKVFCYPLSFYPPCRLLKRFVHVKSPSLTDLSTRFLWRKWSKTKTKIFSFLCLLFRPTIHSALSTVLILNSENPTNVKSKKIRVNFSRKNDRHSNRLPSPLFSSFSLDSWLLLSLVNIPLIGCDVKWNESKKENQKNFNRKKHKISIILTLTLMLAQSN